MKVFITLIEIILIIGAIKVWKDMRIEKKEQMEEKKEDLCLRNFGELSRDYLKILVEYTILMQYSGISNYEIVSGQHMTKREIDVRIFFASGKTKIITLFVDNLLCPKGRLRKDILGINEKDICIQKDKVTEWLMKAIPTINELVQEKIQNGDGVYLYYEVEETILGYIKEIASELNKKTPYAVSYTEKTLEINFQCLLGE